MRRHSPPLFIAALILSSPALSEESRPESEMIESLNDPVFQDHMVAMMERSMTAMLEFPIGQFADAVDQFIPDNLRREDSSPAIDPDATLGDYARRDDPDFDRHAMEKMHRGTEMMGLMAAELGALLPQLRAIGAKMKRSMQTSR